MISYEKLYGQLTKLLQAYVEEGQAIAAESLLVDDLGLDSVQTMEMLMDLEDDLDLSIPMNMLPDVHTVDDLVKALQKVTQ